MPLSEYEERVLAAMELQLVEVDADELEPFPVVDATRFVQFGMLAVVTGLAVLVLSFRTSELLAAVGFVLFFFGSVAAYEGCQAGGVASISRFMAKRRTR